MRIEQLVLYGPRDDDRVRFGSGVTVFSGLGERERADLIETLVDSLTGRMPNASITYTDAAGRKVYADRTGATYAATGELAPAPSDLLGTDSATLTALLRLAAEDLGLGQTITPEQLRTELAEARKELTDLQKTHVEVAEQAALVDEWRAGLAEIDARMDGADEAEARWTWACVRRRLDDARAELTMLDQADAGRSDAQMLESVDALRGAGESWTDLASEAAELRTRVGDLPQVDEQHLARVAATPAELPTGFDGRLESWQASADLRRSAEAELAQIDRAIPEPTDAFVVHFASLDQDRLWTTAEVLEQAKERYEEQAAALGSTDIDPETEARIEDAHVEVVRCERDVDRRFRLGALGTGVLAVAALLVGQAVSLPLGVVMLLGSVGVAARMLVAPRRRLAAAAAGEKDALANTGAGTWLGLHLRRVDAIADHRDRQRFESAAKARAAARLDWAELVGEHDPGELFARADAVRAHAEATNPDAIARRRSEAEAFVAASVESERTARASLTNGLAAYGIVPTDDHPIEPGQLLDVLRARIGAGINARLGKELRQLDQREAEAARRLDAILSGLGYADGDLASRLDRVIGAIAAARLRQGADSPTRPTLESEIADLHLQVQAGVRKGWADDPDPTGPPTDLSVLDARRREIGELIASAGHPDVTGAARRVEIATSKLLDIDQRLGAMSGGPASLRARLLERCARTVDVDGVAEPVPVIIDEALLVTPTETRLELLDALLDESSRSQIVLVTADPVVSSWARQRSHTASVTLYEAEPESEPVPDAGPLTYEPLPYSTSMTPTFR